MSEKRSITYLRGDEALLTDCGETYTLNGNGHELFTWSPKSKRALDLELRIQPQQLVGNDDVNVIPIWRYQIQVTHGDAIHRYPGEGPGVIPSPMLPHRGLLCRLTAKEVRVSFWLDTVLGAETPQKSKVSVSCQPALGSTDRPSIVYCDGFAGPVGTDNGTRRFPIEAKEWRVRDPLGQPIAVGLGAIVFVTTQGGPFALPPITDAALLYDWTPIPTLAAFWAMAIPVECTVEYR